MIAFLEGPDLIVVLVILLLLFGGAKLPKLARSLGEAKRELDKGVNGGSVVLTPTVVAEATPPAPAVTVVPGPVVIVADASGQPPADTVA